VIRNDAVVKGAFTQNGYKHVLANLDSVETLFKRYQWIYGDLPPADKPTKQQLEDTYRADYIRRWQDYLSSASVQGFSSAPEAVARLTQLGSTSSPLFSMLAIASRETQLDSVSPITRAFQPLHATVPPNDPRGLVANVLPYTQALGNLAAPLSAVQSGGPAADQAMIQASTASAAVRQEVGTLSANFIMSGEALTTATQIQRLLRQPAEFADALITSLPAAALNGAARQFCSAATSVLGRYPFSGRADAAPAEVAAFFKKDDGTLWAFYQDKLQTRLTPQGRTRPGQSVRPDFATFFARAADISNAIFRDGALSIIFDFQPEIPAGATDVVLQVDGDRAVYTPVSRASRDFVFEPERSQSAKLTVTLNREVVTVASGEGPWSVFRLFQTAQWSSSSPYRVQWQVPGKNVNLVGIVSFETGVPPLLRPGYLAPLGQCPTVVAN
jgi:type VI protein secretion system component VasK